MKIFNYICLFILFIFVSCASAEKSRKMEIDNSLRPLLNQSQEDIIIKYGTPNKVYSIQGLEVYEYFTDHGLKVSSRSKWAIFAESLGNMAESFDKSYEGKGPVERNYSNEAQNNPNYVRAYDLIQLFFKDKKFVSWRTIIKR